MTDDEQLLHAYARERSESAFGELVTRHIDFVYSAALRVVNGDSHLAQDVTQTVFIDLARKAGSLPRDVVLAGWLHRHTCYTAAKAVRTERRRQTREQTAMEMRALDDNTRPPWELVAPYLDESLNQLNPADRDALVLRFLKQQDLRAVGAALGVSEDAAQKRVDRALEKLHVLLTRRGAALSAAALGTALATEAVTAAPAGLAGSIAGTALASAAAGGGMTLTLLKVMGMTKLKLGIISAIVVAGMATPLVLQHQAQIKLREDNQALRQQSDQVAAENERLSHLAARANSSQTLANGQPGELLRLRGEVGVLRQQKSEAERLLEEHRRLGSGATNSQSAQATNPPTPFSAPVPKESWAFSGYATPEAALQTMAWAWGNRDWEALLASATPDGRKELEKTFGGKPASEALAAFPIDLSKASSYTFKKKKEVSDDEVVFDLAYELPFNLGYGRQVTMKRVGGEWKAEW
jgi:RNA polymerase sigma factor (sigma-70 family)